ncbi:Uncharacterized conserved protein YjiS, DUF1127 family [Salinihabitans flavidus]|uniref:Uncharacterized conserved protein YjiS, DUF1127 family n=1 Tax=Salinihabitans flavidus TaxID=569882 RepID=A0A1H8W652_9RHOB|nr:DUF1127 domain-containing protein [Salinihabitans flavidus]SEP23079.1 Uncharacterized conserved protein YjiS, DUF1127 family [Salinihabitans flavidus]
MALATQHSFARTGLGAWMAATVAAVTDTLRKRHAFRKTVTELSALSDRELADLGLNRSAIRSVAYQAAYAN